MSLTNFDDIMLEVLADWEPRREALSEPTMHDVTNVISDYPFIYAPYLPLFVTCPPFQQLEFDFVNEMRPQREHQMSLELDESLIIATLNAQRAAQQVDLRNWIDNARRSGSILNK